MTTKELFKWCGLVAFVTSSIIGQAELIGEPWRHYVTVISVIATAVCGYLIQHRDEWDGIDRRADTDSHIGGI